MDLPGSPIKDILKQLSLNLYRDLKMESPLLQSIVDESWDKLLETPHNNIIPKNSLPKTEDYNLLRIPEKTIQKKKIRHYDISEALIAHGSGHSIPHHCNPKSHTYGSMIDQTEQIAALNLGTWLKKYLQSLPE